MNAKISGFVICFEAIIYLLLYNLHDCTFNPFLTNIPILYPLKTPENQVFFGVFRGYKMGILAENVLI